MIGMDRKVVIRKNRREFRMEKRYNWINYLYFFYKPLATLDNNMWRDPRKGIYYPFDVRAF